MSPIDRELMETLGELVLTKRAFAVRPALLAGGIGAGAGAAGVLGAEKFRKKDFTDAPAQAGQAVSKKMKQTRAKIQEAGRQAAELGKDPLFVGSAVAGSALGMLVIHKINKLRAARGEQPVETKVAAEKTAVIFGPTGKALDFLLRRGAAGAKRVLPAPKTLLDWGVKKPYNLAMEAGGVRGLSRESQLISALRANPTAAADWATVKALAEARGIKSPATFISSIMSPMQTISGRTSQGGQARWLLGRHLRDPVRLQQFLHGASPREREAVQRLMQTFGAQAAKAGDVSIPAQLAPFAIFGGPLAYNLMKEQPGVGERPVVSAPNRGIMGDREVPREPNAVERMWTATGEKVRGVSPGLGEWLAAHPYLSTAAASGLAGAGLYGLTGLFGKGDGA